MCYQKHTEMLAKPAKTQILSQGRHLGDHCHVERHRTGKRQSDAVPTEDSSLCAFFEFFDRTENAVKAPAEGLSVFKVVPQSVRYDVDVLYEVGDILDNRWHDRIIEQPDERFPAAHSSPRLSGSEVDLHCLLEFTLDQD